MKAISVGLYLTAALMRRWPRSIRRLDWWWDCIYRAIGGGGYSTDENIDASWPAGLQKPVRGKLHPFRLKLNLKDWLERRAYFSGQLYQRDLEFAVTTILREGDCFIDIGANIGLVALLAASRIGRSGRLIAIEANPTVFARLKDHLDSNALAMPAEAINVALGADSSTALMHVSQGHAGTGTLTLGGGTIKVCIRPADDVISVPNRNQPLCVKIDVEGYEGRVVAGMSSLLSRENVAVFIEISKDMLARIGDSSGALHQTLQSAGFCCYLFQHSIGRWGESLHFEQSDVLRDEWQYDALYVKRGSVFEDRIRPYIRQS